MEKFKRRDPEQPDRKKQVSGLDRDADLRPEPEPEPATCGDHAVSPPVRTAWNAGRTGKSQVSRGHVKESGETNLHKAFYLTLMLSGRLFTM